MCSKFKIYRLNSRHPLMYRLRRFVPDNDSFDRLFRFSPDGILIVRNDGCISMANPAILWMLGIVDERLLDSSFNIFQFIDENDQETISSALEMVLNGLVPATRLEATFKRKDGTSFFAELAIGAFSESNNPTAQVIVHDITDFRMAEEHSMQIHMDLEMSFTATINGWSRGLELRDRETPGHSARVTDKTIEIALKIGVSIEQIMHVRHGALLHDIGKMAIPDSILFKPGPLSVYERNVMEQHPSFAYNLLHNISYLKPALTIPYSHHEKFDGTGYPQKLKYDEIPIEARIFAIVDTWDSLSSDRPYRTAWPDEKVRQYIADDQGQQFDPSVVDIFLETL